MRVVILHNRPGPGSGADDHDTIVQVQTVKKALLALGHEVMSIPFSLNLPDTGGSLRGACPDVVFNLVEGAEGSGRCIHYAPALLEDLGIPFTGAGSSAMALSSNKLFAKAVLTAFGIATPDWRTMSGRGPEAALGEASLAGPWIVKSVWEHASIGLDSGSVLHADGEVILRVILRQRAPQLGGECFAERYVEGREFNIAMLDGPNGPRVLPVAEMLFEGDWGGAPRILGYSAKWDEGAREYAATRRSFAADKDDALLHATLREAALACWHAFGLSGYARVDFRVGADGRPQAIDINANPCLSPDSGLRAALEQNGTSFEDAVAAVLWAAFDRSGASSGCEAA